MKCGSTLKLHRMDIYSETIEFICQILISFFFLRWNITSQFIKNWKTTKRKKNSCGFIQYIYNLYVVQYFEKSNEWIFGKSTNYSVQCVLAHHIRLYIWWMDLVGRENPRLMCLWGNLLIAPHAYAFKLRLCSQLTHNEKRNVFVPKINCT